MYRKYPEIKCLPWSVIQIDGRVSDPSKLYGKDIVITSLLKGVNVTLYNDIVQYKDTTVDPSVHEAMMVFHEQIKHKIPGNARFCGVCTSDMRFHMFSVWHIRRCIPWDETVIVAETLKLNIVPVLYEGPWNNVIFDSLVKIRFKDMVHGYVVRNSNEFILCEFDSNVMHYIAS